jgi:hypothetical protein
MVDPKKLLEEMTDEEYENLTGQKKPAVEAPASILPSVPHEPTLDEELARDPAQLND